MVKHYPRERYPERVVASTDVIVALQEQAGMDPVTATLAANGELSEAELAWYELDSTQVGDLTVASVLNTAASRDKKR